MKNRPHLVLIILACLSVFYAIGYCYAQYAPDDLNLDGKKDFNIKFRSDNPLSSRRGENYKYAEFDTNFDGNMDIIINFDFPFGSLKSDTNFDGVFDVEYFLFHIPPLSVDSPSWLGRLDTWHVIGLFTGVRTLLSYLIESYLVAENNYILTINQSIKNGLDIDAKDVNGETLLLRVFKSGFLKAAELLIRNGANVNARNNDGMTVLMQALERGFPELAKITILFEEINVQKDNLQIVNLLIEKGANINAKSKDFSTALTLAIKRGYLETVRLLIERGADVNATDNDGLTPLMQVIKKNYNGAGYLDTVNLLIKNKANVNAQDNNGLTALMLAMQKDNAAGSLDLARLLVEKGADINAKADDGSTVLMQIVKRPELGYSDIARILIERGAADIHIRDKDGLTVLMAAVQAGVSKTPLLLIEKGADINAKDNEGLTALIQRGRKCDFNMVWLLINAGADVDARDVNGDTVLTQFIKGGYPDQADSLVTQGLTFDVKNKDGMTPFMYAVEKGYLKLVEVLLAKGADIKIQNNSGQTVLDIAQKEGNNEMLSLIKQYRVRQMQLYRNEKYGFEVKVFTDRAPIINEWEKKWHPDTPQRVWEADFFDMSIGVLNLGKEPVEIPAVKITVNECLPQQDLDLCLQAAVSDCQTLPYGELIVNYGNESLRVSPYTLSGLPAKKMKVSCIKNVVYEGIAMLRENRLYTLMFLTAFESAMVFPIDLVNSMISTFSFTAVSGNTAEKN